MKFLHNKLLEREQSGSLRSLQTFPHHIDFFSNDYLGLSHDAFVSSRIKELLEHEQLADVNGSSGSRLLSGNLPFYEKTEQFMADFFESESALIYHSGYSALLGVLSCIPQRTDTIVYDEFVHASARDGIRLSMARNFSFSHNNLYDLEDKLKKSTGRIWVVVESVYSMDGDSAPLIEIIELQQKYDFVLLIDEAHSGGITGEEGRGLAHAWAGNENIIRIITFGKAFGTEGACVLGPEILRNYLINFSRPFIYSTAPSPHFFASIRASVEAVQKADKQRKTLTDNISFFQKKFEGMMPCHSSPIQILKGKDIGQLKALATFLSENRMAVRPIFSPTVPQGQERIRMVIHAFNTAEEIEKLCTLIQEKSPTS
ncbi:MAG: aminotransferase class I/II-fold pyridoxal phosphate-dependent enzyme [Flavobacteriales bacterium]|nr:aminotransferase class I/II-fold pyridoxal phosphate-dependent enzyme [Flavobacteriales bacterium]